MYLPLVWVGLVFSEFFKYLLAANSVRCVTEFLFLNFPYIVMNCVPIYCRDFKVITGGSVFYVTVYYKCCSLQY